MRKDTLSRRSFISLGAMAAGAAALAGCAAPTPAENTPQQTVVSSAPAWLGVEPEIPAEEIVSVEETDLLIVGAGTAGMMAAGTAADLGVKFILCEKTGTVQETREYWGIVNSPAAAAFGAPATDPLKLLNELTRYASGKCNQDLIKMWIDESAESFLWMDEKMAKAGKMVIVDAVNPDHPTGGTDYYVPTLQHIHLAPYVPPMRNDILLQAIQEKGHEPRWNHTMVKLVHDEAGVTGAIFSTDKGYVQINAKNTLLATGGYPANPVMMSALSPAAVSCCTSSSYAPTCDGLGIRAGIWAGASMDPDEAPMIFDRGSVAPGVTTGYVGEGPDAVFPGNIYQENIGSQPFLKVNRKGKRFANESVPYDSICNQAAQQPGGVWCQVFDSNYAEDIIRFSTIGCSGFAKMSMLEGVDVETYCGMSFNAGIFKKADTLEELADQLGFTGEDKASFLKQVEDYNALAAAGVDTQYGKETYRLSSIVKAPFYGCWFGGTLLTTLDGLRVNAECQVIKADGEVIPGLYAAGDCSGSFFSGNYPEYLVGVASGRSSVQGRHIVRKLAGNL